MDDTIRRLAQAAIGFQWHAEMWHRGRVVLSDAEIDAMEARMWAQRHQPSHEEKREVTWLTGLTSQKIRGMSPEKNGKRRRYASRSGGGIALPTVSVHTAKAPSPPTP